MHCAVECGLTLFRFRLSGMQEDLASLVVSRFDGVHLELGAHWLYLHERSIPLKLTDSTRKFASRRSRGIMKRGFLLKLFNFHSSCLLSKVGNN